MQSPCNKAPRNSAGLDEGRHVVALPLLFGSVVDGCLPTHGSATVVAFAVYGRRRATCAQAAEALEQARRQGTFV